MADITITAANVLPVSGASFVTGFNAGVLITAGQVVYLDASNLWQLTDCNLSATAAGSGTTVGIAVNDARANCRLTVQISGDLNPGGTLTAGKTYVASATAGGIAPITDNASGWITTLLGTASTSSNLKLNIFYTGCTT